MDIKVQSSAFKNGESIPARFTCDGANVSPNIKWSKVRGQLKTYLLLMEDLDIKNGITTHWILFNIPKTINELHEDVTPVRNIPDEVMHGTNDFGRVGYKGPCPSAGAHRYAFHVFALDRGIPLDAGATKRELLKAMEGHIIGEGKLIGKYVRPK